MGGNMSDQQFKVEMDTKVKTGKSLSDETYDNEVLDPRQIDDNLWLVFRGLYRNSENNSRQGICEFFLSRVKNPDSSSDYIVAEKLIIVCKQGDLSQGGNQPEELSNAVGIVYSRQCVVQSGERFIFTGETQNPNINEQEFSF
jgi:hypothetical protein